MKFFKSCVKMLGIVVAMVGMFSVSAHAGGSVTFTKPNGDAVKVSMEQLMEMPATEFYTSTPWTNGVQKFQGVSFALLIDKFGLNANQVRVAALNDYNVIVPTNVLREDGAILAYQLNDAEMSVREKGPFWVVFPYDKDARLQTDTYWSYSVWQVKSVDAKN
jgi:hypothetical protein